MKWACWSLSLNVNIEWAVQKCDIINQWMKRLLLHVLSVTSSLLLYSRICKVAGYNLPPGWVQLLLRFPSCFISFFTALHIAFNPLSISQVSTIRDNRLTIISDSRVWYKYEDGTIRWRCLFTTRVNLECIVDSGRQFGEKSIHTILKHTWAWWETKTGSSGSFFTFFFSKRNRVRTKSYSVCSGKR